MLDFGPLTLTVDSPAKSPKFVMPVPDQVRDDGSGIQNILKSLDSDLRRSKILMPFAGNKVSRGFQIFYEFVKVEK